MGLKYLRVVVNGKMTQYYHRIYRKMPKASKKNNSQIRQWWGPMVCGQPIVRRVPPSFG